MQKLSMDIVKPTSTNSYESWSRWMNWIQSQLNMSLNSRKVIQINELNNFIDLSRYDFDVEELADTGAIHE